MTQDTMGNNNWASGMASNMTGEMGPSQAAEVDHHQADRNKVVIEPAPNAPKDTAPSVEGPHEATPEEIRQELVRNRGGAYSDRIKIDMDTSLRNTLLRRQKITKI